MFLLFFKFIVAIKITNNIGIPFTTERNIKEFKLEFVFIKIQEIIETKQEIKLKKYKKKDRLFFFIKFKPFINYI